MNTPTSIAILAVSTFSLLTSGATLAVVLIGAKKMHTEVEETKTKMNRTVHNLKYALDDMEI